MTKIAIVTFDKCCDCPYNRSSGTSFYSMCRFQTYCIHPKYEDTYYKMRVLSDDEDFDYTIPKWCPLEDYNEKNATNPRK